MNLTSFQSSLALAAMSAMAISSGAASPVGGSVKATTKGFSKPSRNGNNRSLGKPADVKKNRATMAAKSRRQQRNKK